MYDNQNIFAKIIRKEIPANIILENDNAISLYDVNPTSSKHALVIPKGQYKNILDFVKNAKSQEQVDFWQMFNNTAEKLGLNNFNILVNVGEGVYFKQSIPHFHLHLIGGEKIKEISDLK
ncbi:MAG: HIT domain-containing protein [Alphaproteobacteria bacterium]|nr:HIT domain-containing protein [Alphaproteobacteria bacterium]MBN2674903.1 HIT domain-containing protein [Alphaproteobacteria bacterium]